MKKLQAAIALIEDELDWCDSVKGEDYGVTEDYKHAFMDGLRQAHLLLGLVKEVEEE